MRINNLLLLAVCFQAGILQGQVLAPAEILDKDASALQQKHFADLKTIANNVKNHSFPYHFYFSRVLDIPEQQEPGADQRSIQFDRFQGKMILKITGNYFASYPGDSMEREQRARQTFSDVMLPILRAAVVQFHEADAPESFALEISHHVRKKVLGVVTEGVENVVLVLPRDSARDLVTAQDEGQRNAALLKAAAFLDGKPLTFWPGADSAGEAIQDTAIAEIPKPAPQPSVPAAAPHVEFVSTTSVNSSLESLQGEYRPALDRMVRELDAQAHFVTYAAPAFIEFHRGRYLQLSVVVTLSDTPVGSQYQVSALSFDNHIAHLIRPILSYLKGAQDFDGIDFSASVRFAADPASGSKFAVEYLFPMNELRKYESYDFTGQQLLDASFVLINGERVGLNLQAAESR